MTDVTVACGDVSLEAHSLILSASSPILRSILAKGNAGWPGRKQVSTLNDANFSVCHFQALSIKKCRAILLAKLQNRSMKLLLNQQYTHLLALPV